MSRIAPTTAVAVSMLLVLACAAASRADDEATVRLEGVPASLTLPLPADANQVVTASIRGVDIRDAWLAADERSKARVMLTRTDAQEWQINLADPQVHAVLSATDGARPAGQFYVFAETAGGKVLRSVPVRFTVADTDARRKWPRLLASPGSFPTARVYLRGKRSPVQIDGPLDGFRMKRLFTPPDVSAVEIELPRPLAGRNVVAFVKAEPKWRLDRSPDEQATRDGGAVRRLTMTPEIRDAWDRAGRLYLSLDPGDADADEVDARIVFSGFFLRAIPTRLDLGEKAEPIEFTVGQRQTEPVPGSRDYLEVSLGDITAGQVTLAVTADDGKTFVNRRSVRTGQRLPLALRGGRYTLTVVQLVNHLIGDDLAILRISADAPAAPEKTTEPAGRAGDGDGKSDANSGAAEIDELLKTVEHSGLTFIRDGREYTGVEAAAFLRGKMEVMQERDGTAVTSADAFIEKVVSRSRGAEPYEVRLEDGRTKELSEWLREQLETEQGGDGGNGAGAK